MPQKALGSIIGLLCTGATVVQTKEFCFGVNNEQYRCEMGYCCGETECCTYYYELWWFWLVWTLIIILSCCCAYRHRRVKMRLQQEQRQREISLMAYQGASSSFVSPPPLNLRLWTDCKLPDYEEVVGHPPTPPPPYSEMPSEVPPAGQGAVATTAIVLEPPMERQSILSCDQPSSSATGERAAAASSSELVSVQPQQEQEQREEASSAGLLEDEEELGTRRRHVTGDSGIEMCVCQMDTDQTSGTEENDFGAESREHAQLCQGGGGVSAAHWDEQEAPAPPCKDHKPKSEARSKPSCTGDRLV